MFGRNEVVGLKFFEAEVKSSSLLVASMFLTLQGEGPFSGLPALFIRLAKCNLSCTFCLPSNTDISVLDRGSMRLDEVRVGDNLLTLDKDLSPAWTRVRKVMTRWVPRTEVLSIEYKEDGARRKILATKDHPFNVRGKGFVAAKDLKHGQVIHHIPGEQRIAKNMEANNPMHEAKTCAKVHRTLASKRKTGELVPYDRTETWRRNQSDRMSEKNPLHFNATVKKVTQSKTYRKSNLEKAYQRLLNKLGFDVKYVGNKPDWLIGDDRYGYMRPDFVLEGTKCVLEVYDTSYPFYTEARHTAEGEKKYKSARRRHYKRFGFKVEFLTAQGAGFSRSYENPSSTEAVTKNLNKFLTNGVEVLSVSVLSRKGCSSMSHAGTYRPDNGGEISVTNFSCAPHNTFCVKGLHTHNCDTQFDAGDRMTYEEILGKAERIVSAALKKWDLKMEVDECMSSLILVLSGGEPTLQALSPFITFIAGRFRRVQIESNGTLECELPARTVLVVSPKCSERNGVPMKYLTPRANMLARANCLKFVMSADESSPYNIVPEWAFKWKTEQLGREIFCSPMNIYLKEPKKSPHGASMEERSGDETVSFWESGLLNMEQNRKNHEYAAAYCLRNGLRLNLQTHLMASLP